MCGIFPGMDDALFQFFVFSFCHQTLDTEVQKPLRCRETADKVYALMDSLRLNQATRRFQRFEVLLLGRVKGETILWFKIDSS